VSAPWQWQEAPFSAGLKVLFQSWFLDLGTKRGAFSPRFAVSVEKTGAPFCTSDTLHLVLSVLQPSPKTKPMCALNEDGASYKPHKSRTTYILDRDRPIM
jgi:hypothetical protein